MKFEKNTIEEFLKKYESSNSTYRSYKSHINKYFKTIKKNSNRYIPVNIRILDNGGKVEIEDRIIKDLKLFSNIIRETPPKSQQSCLAVIKKYLQHFYIDIPQREWDNIKTSNKLKRIRSETPKKTPSVQELKYILRSTGLKQKTFISMASSTGLRIEELLKIKLEDIDIENRSVISLRKGNYYGVVFFIPETQELLKEWFKEREKYFKTKTGKSIYTREQLEKQGYKIETEEIDKKKHYNIKDVVKDNRLFPFTEATGRSIWYNLIENAGPPFNKKNVINEKNVDINGEPKGRYEYNFHCLRRFWLSQLHNTHINKKHYDAIGGHISNLDNDYIEVTTHNEEKAVERKKSYDKHSNCLAIFSDYQKAKSELGEKIGYQTRMLQRLNDENQYLKDELEIIKVEKIDEEKEYNNLKKYLQCTLMPKFYNMEDELKDIKNYYQEQKEREKIQEQLDKKEESMSPEQKKKEAEKLKKALEESKRREDEKKAKEALKTPEQKAKEKRELDEEFKNIWTPQKNEQGIDIH